MDDSKITSRVVDHYNNVESGGLKSRWQSSNLHQKNFNNWIKSVIIAKALTSVREGKAQKYEVEVLDMGSGKGGDLLKWQKGNISKIILVDVADVSVNQSRERYEDLRKREQRQNLKHRKDENSQHDHQIKRYKMEDSIQQYRNTQPSSSFQYKFTEDKHIPNSFNKNNNKNNNNNNNNNNDKIETSQNSVRSVEYRNLNSQQKVDGNVDNCNRGLGNSGDQGHYNRQHGGAYNRNTQKLFSAEFITADCTRTKLWKRFSNAYQLFDIVSSQFCFHYSFESLYQTRTWLSNASDSLKVGGYFIGTIVDSNTLLKRLRSSENMSFGNDVYKVEFLTKDKDNIPLFNAKYNFYLDGSVDCPEFLVHFPLMKKLAEEHGLKLVYCKSFKEVFDENCHSNNFKSLLKRMYALEEYPSDEARKGAEQYKHVDRVIKSGQASSVFTLSQEEWEIASLYRVFSFQKT